MGNLSLNTLPDSVASPTRPATVASNSRTAASDSGEAVQTQGNNAHSAAAERVSQVTALKGVVVPDSGVYVLQAKNLDTGEVAVQYPSAKVVAAYKQTVETSAPAESSSKAATADTSSGSTASTGTPAPAPSPVASTAGTSSTVAAAAPVAAPVAASGPATSINV